MTSLNPTARAECNPISSGSAVVCQKAIQKGETRFLSYGRQHISEEDIQAVENVLRSDWLTQGPTIEAFEKDLGGFLGAHHVVACSSGTAALHLAMLALGIGAGDEVVTTPNTFLASANCARFVGADVRFADIDATTGLMDLNSLSAVLEADRKKKIKVVIPVHFAGQPVELPQIYGLAKTHGAWVVDDACHALGAEYHHKRQWYRVGSGPHSDMTVFSFHPVKHVAMGEGGAITTHDRQLTDRLCRFRTHGAQKEQFEYAEMAFSPEGVRNPWYYEMHELGYNYRLTDIQAALGRSQLKRLSWSLERRNRLAAIYCRLIRECFSNGDIRTLTLLPDRKHAYHLFVVLIDFERFGVSRAVVMNHLIRAGVGTQVHYIPVHLQPYYRNRYGTSPGDFPQAELYYTRALSLPMYPDLSEEDIERVVRELKNALLVGR
ncbi:MAG: UDP-4-amino-4,6-dideoxy-N-acetyl-beta-L-altrosamine transaminase [Candidatus Zixiibacteriota bacterium]